VFKVHTSSEGHRDRTAIEQARFLATPRNCRTVLELDMEKGPCNVVGWRGKGMRLIESRGFIGVSERV
jgi:hypothetical protein